MFWMVIILLFGPVCFYIGSRILRWLHHVKPTAVIRNWIFWTIFSLFILFPFITRFLPSSPVMRYIKAAGNYWFGIFVFLLISILMTDLIRLIMKLFRWHPRFISTAKGALIIGLAVIFTITGIMVYGVDHAGRMTVKDYTIYIDKYTGKDSDLNMVVIADLHLGEIIGLNRVKEMVTLINSQNADIVCMVGDIFDSDFGSVYEADEIRSQFQQIQSKYGVFAVFGNHDAGNTYHDMVAFLKSAGITLLEDESILIDNWFTLVGRKDRSPIGKNGEKRQELTAFTSGVDFSKPVIVLDHQPDSIEETKAFGADLMISGHTHAGHYFPITILTNLQYQVSYGYKEFDTLQMIVTSGVGTWGVPMRIATNSEIVSIKISFNKYFAAQK